MTFAMLVHCSHKLSLKPLRCEQVSLLGPCVPGKGMMSEKHFFDIVLVFVFRLFLGH